MAAVKSSGEVAVVLNRLNAPATPCAVARRNGEWVVGQPAVDLLERQSAAVILDPIGALAAGESAPGDGQALTPKEALAALLGRLCEDAAYRFQARPARCVVAVPADIPGLCRERVAEIAQQAGWAGPRIAPAPVAAAVSCLKLLPARDRVLLLVADWGDSGCTVSAVLVEGKRFSFLAQVGSKTAGVARFHEALTAFALDFVTRQFDVDGAQQPRFLVHLQAEARKAVRELNTQDSACLLVVGALKGKGGELLDLEVDISRQQFEEMIAQPVSEGVALLDQALAELGAEMTDVDAVILVNSGAGVPLVVGATEGKVGQGRLLRGVHPEQCVAFGAALMAGPEADGLEICHTEDPRSYLRGQVPAEPWEPALDAKPDLEAAAPGDAAEPPGALSIEPSSPAAGDDEGTTPLTSGDELAGSPAEPAPSVEHPEPAVEPAQPPTPISPEQQRPEGRAEEVPVEMEQPLGEPDGEVASGAAQADAVGEELEGPPVVEPSIPCHEPAPIAAESEPAPPGEAVAAVPEEQNQEQDAVAAVEPEAPAAPAEPLALAGAAHEPVPPEPASQVPEASAPSHAAQPAAVPSPAPESVTTPREPTHFGRYRVVSVLFEDAHHRCYLAEDDSAGRPVRVRAYPAAEEGARRAFMRAATASHFSSPRIERIVDLGMEDRSLFIVADGLDRTSVWELLRSSSEVKPLPLGQAVEIGTGLLEALEVVHRCGIFHRSVKPENVVVAAQGNQVWLTGFEACMLLSPGLRIRSAAVALRYTAPEVLLGATDHRADLYSAAVVLYEMLSGTVPFPEDDAERVKARILTEPPVPLTTASPSVPRELSALVMRGLEKDPSQRMLLPYDLRRFLQRKKPKG
jgi:hypothetical protein